MMDWYWIYTCALKFGKWNFQRPLNVSSLLLGLQYKIKSIFLIVILCLTLLLVLYQTLDVFSFMKKQLSCRNDDLVKCFTFFLSPFLALGVHFPCLDLLLHEKNEIFRSNALPCGCIHFMLLMSTSLSRSFLPPKKDDILQK